MTERPDDLVRVATGELAQVQGWADALTANGIQSRVVGGDLSAGIGSALPGSVELWVHRNDHAATDKVIAGHHPHGFQPASHPTAGFGHPTSDPKPDRSRGPTHGAPPHRPLPS